MKKQSQELTRVNPDRNIFSINVGLTSTFLLYRGLVHHHHWILNHRNLFCELSKVSKLNAFILPAPETRRTLMHLFLFTNTAQRELVSICTQRIRNSNYLSLPYYLHLTNQRNTKLIFKKRGLKLWNQIHNPGSIRKQIFV